MKNSGIEWIGEIPDSWEYFRLKDYYLFEKGKNAAIYTQDYIGLNKGDYPVYSGQTENEGVMGLIDTFDYDIDECLFTTTVGAKVMTPKILRGKFSLSQNCLIMKKTKECNNSYIYYYLFPLFSYAKSLIPTYMQPSLRVADLNLYGLYVPDCETQYKIAKCLNEKCGKIDELIANQEKQIEKLKEYKLSVITEAVTKGLDKSAPMKDSGIEWIGEIPADWELVKIGSIFKCRNEKVNDTDYPPLSVSKGGVVPQMENVAKSDANDNRKLVLQNDFVINSRSDRKQSCGVSPLEGSVSLINTVLYTDNQETILPFYANLVMKNYGFAEEFYRWGHGIVADLWTTRWQEMKSIVLPLPSIEIQEEILCYVKSKMESVDRLIAIKQEKIEKLNEYKKSLIYEYVTGKKEVV